MSQQISETSKKRFIAGIPPTTTLDDLRQEFSKYGKIYSVDVKRGYGFVVKKEN